VISRFQIWLPAGWRRATRLWHVRLPSDSRRNAARRQIAALGQQETLRPLSKAREIVVGSILSCQQDVPMSDELNGSVSAHGGRDTDSSTVVKLHLYLEDSPRS
jgi:hypothetical protein